MPLYNTGVNLSVKNLSVKIAGKDILKKVSFEILPGKIIALMGPNGSGKSTLAQVIMGHPSYTAQNSSSIKLANVELLDLSADKRAKLGLFLAFQNPVSVPGVNVANLLKTTVPSKDVLSFNEFLYKKSLELNIPAELLRRGLNEDFSGGEKKKLEMLQAVILKPKFAIFDEIDTGLDVDALKTVAKGISELKKLGCGILLITHYQRILKFAKPDYVYILVNGQIKEKGSSKLSKEIEKKGYKKWL